MFLSRFKNVARRGFELGRTAVSKAPSLVRQALDYGNQASKTAKQIGDTATRVRDVYNKSQDFVKPSGKVNNFVQKSFDTVNEGVKRIDNANRVLQGVGGNVLTLF